MVTLSMTLIDLQGHFRYYNWFHYLFLKNTRSQLQRSDIIYEQYTIRTVIWCGARPC